MVVNFAPHVRVSAIGDIGLPAVDHFSFGFNMAPANTSIVAAHFLEPAYPYWQDVADSVRDMFNNAACLVNSDAHITAVKVAWIQANGSYARKPPIVIPYASAGGGSNAGYAIPQTALAVTLLTDTVGPRTRGRFFLPMPNSPVNNANGFRITMPIATACAQAVAGHLNDINNAPGVDAIGQEWRVVIASSTGINTEVTGVKVGRVIDTIRTRRNAIKEDYTPVQAVTP